MNFFKNFFGGKPDKPEQRMTLNEVLKDIHFSQCEKHLLIDEEHRIGFKSAENVAYLLRLGPAPLWDFDLRNLDGATAFYGNQCAENKGAMLSLKLTKTDGAEALQGLFKYRSPGNPLAILYVGILWVPFMEATLQINVEAVEQGTTGMREALVMTKMMDDGTFEDPHPFEPPRKVESAEEMFKLMAEKPLSVRPSDAEKWDEKMSQHPLSLVRKNLEIVANTLNLEASMHSLKPFRHE